MTVANGGIAALPMYPFAPLRQAHEQLWSAVRRQLGWGPEQLEWTVVAPEVWHHPELVLAQACGWPLVTRLQEQVEVVGTFDYDVPGASNGRYRSVVIARRPDQLDALRADPATRVAVNSDDSLSGWVSLQWLWGRVPEHVVGTGAHAHSVRAVAGGSADVASIDAVSWALLSALDPQLVAALHIVGHGPEVPCLPIVAGWRQRSNVPAFRAALAGALADPATEHARSLLRIRGFVPLVLADYLPLKALLE